MKTCNIFLVAVAVVALVCTSGCITKSNVTTTGSSPRFVPGTTNVVYETFEHRDRSLRVVQPEWSGGGGGNIFRFRAAVGGGGTSIGNQYGYGGGGYHSSGTYVQGLAGPQPMNGWPAVTVPIESQRFYQEQTWRAYGFGEGSGSYHPPVQSGGWRYGY